MSEANIIAAAALILWPFMALIFFKYLPIGRAMIASILVSYLFLPPLPAGFDFPLFPALNKESIPNIVLVILCVSMAKERIQWLPKNIIARVLVILFVLSPMATVFTNQEPIFYGFVGLPGLRFVEAVSICIQQALFVVPMLLARHFLANEEDQRDIMIALVLTGLVYSLPTLVEVRLSPQLNLWIYGFFQHNFEQTIRFGGYRPLVFLYHGIWLAFFMMTTVIAAFALLRRTPGNTKFKYLFAAFYLLAVLVLCKSAGALIFAVLLIPLVMVFGQKMQMTIAAMMAVTTLLYPVLKQTEVVPTEAILSTIKSVSNERANSLEFRFDNEDVLLERAEQKPLFGWGSWGRNHLLDPITGTQITVADGRWVIVIGVFGWLGYLAEFGLLGFPVLMVWWKSLQTDSKDLPPFIGPLTLLLAVNILDLIPNATITPMTWLFAGIILGYTELSNPRRNFVPVEQNQKQTIQTVI